jgi:hypothetical protein
VDPEPPEVEETEVERLRRLKDEAIEAEDYPLAARLRDEQRRAEKRERGEDV